MILETMIITITTETIIVAIVIMITLIRMKKD